MLHTSGAVCVGGVTAVGWVDSLVVLFPVLHATSSFEKAIAFADKEPLQRFSHKECTYVCT